jgi:hypothetical protein
MPLTIVTELSGTPNPVEVPGTATLTFKVRSIGSPVHAWATYEVDPGVAVWFQRDATLVSSFQVDLGTVPSSDREIDQAVQFNWGPGTKPEGFFRVIVHVTEASGPVLQTETNMVIADARGGTR